MRAYEFMDQLRPIGKVVDTLNEIITIDELVQPSEEHKRRVADIAKTPVKGFPNIYWGESKGAATIVSKKDDVVLGYTICLILDNPNSTEYPYYVCPKNLYSWAHDGGVTALNLIKASIRLAGDTPVMSDIQLSRAAKKFLRKNVESGALCGSVFNLKTGKVTPYDPDIWVNDDDYRILFMEHGGMPYPLHPLLVESGSWYWKQIIRT
jgi:hypothetical protein